MKKTNLGTLILIAGILLGIYAFLFDVSVNASTNGLLEDLYKQNPNLVQDKFANIDLLNRRECLVIVAGVLCIIGTILVIVPEENKDYEIVLKHTRAQTKLLSLIGAQLNVTADNLNPVIEDIQDSEPLLFEHKEDTK